MSDQERPVVEGHDPDAVDLAHTQGVPVGGTSHSECEGCATGDHKKHDPEAGADPNLLVQFTCQCSGDCAKRHKRDHLSEWKP